MAAVAELIVGGESLSRALIGARAIAPTTHRLVAAGEQSGRLPHMLAHAAALEQSRATRTTRQMLRLLEPSILFLIAGAVATIAAALLQAVYSVRPS